MKSYKVFLFLFLIISISSFIYFFWYVHVQDSKIAIAELTCENEICNLPIINEYNYFVYNPHVKVCYCFRAGILNSTTIVDWEKV
jgi:hypothetical protein